VNSKKNVDASVHKIAQTSSIAVGNKPTNHNAQNGEVSPDIDVNVFGDTIFESSDIALIQNAEMSTKVSMHNSFELLDNDCELITWEAKQVELETTHITIAEVNTNYEEISMVMGNLTHITNSEDLEKLIEGTSEMVILSSKNPWLDSDNER